MSKVRVDTIEEYTSANGITIDGVNIKDSKIVTANSIDSDVYIDGSIDTAHIADNQITLAKMASGTDGNIISYDASGNPVAVATGSDGQVLTSSGAGAVCAFEAIPASGGTLTAKQDAVSGTAVDFTGIPSGTKWITVQVLNCSADGVGEMGIQLGDSGGIETSGYLGAVHGSANTSAHGVFSTSKLLIMDPLSAASGYSGVCHLRLQDSGTFAWCFTSTTGATNSANFAASAGGSKLLSAELTQVRFITDNTFDSTPVAGSVSIQYGT